MNYVKEQRKELQELKRSIAIARNEKRAIEKEIALLNEQQIALINKPIEQKEQEIVDSANKIFDEIVVYFFEVLCYATFYYTIFIEKNLNHIFTPLLISVLISLYLVLIDNTDIEKRSSISYALRLMRNTIFRVCKDIAQNVLPLIAVIWYVYSDKANLFLFLKDNISPILCFIMAIFLLITLAAMILIVVLIRTGIDKIIYKYKHP